MKKKIVYILAVVIVLAVPIALVVSCRNSSRVVDNHAMARTMKATDIITKLATNKASYQYLSANVTATVIRQGSIPIRLTGQLRMKHDSIVWLNLTGPLGIGSARLLVTNDSVYIVSSFDKTCRCGKFDNVLRHYGVAADFASVENALIGNGTILPAERFVVTDDKIKPNDNHYVVPTESQNSDMLSINEVQVSPRFKITQLNAKYGKQGEVVLRYSNFSETEIGIMPRQFNLQLNHTENIKVEMEYSKITVNEKKDFPFKIASNYKIKRIK